MITAPNFYSELPDDRWEIIDPNTQTLWLQLNVDDSLGLRRYVPASGSSISVIFQRADAFALSGVKLNRLQSETRTITKTATANADDRSLWSISMTAQDVSGVVSGTVKFSITESAVTQVWLQNYFVKKNLTDPGF